MKKWEEELLRVSAPSQSWIWVGGIPHPHVGLSIRSCQVPPVGFQLNNAGVNDLDLFYHLMCLLSVEVHCHQPSSSACLSHPIQREDEMTDQGRAKGKTPSSAPLGRELLCTEHCLFIRCHVSPVYSFPHFNLKTGPGGRHITSSLHMGKQWFKD